MNKIQLTTPLRVSLRLVRLRAVTSILLAAGSGLYAQTDAATSPADAVYAKRNEENLAASAKVKKEGGGIVPGLTNDYNHIIFYGQSLSVGADSKQQLSTTAKDGNYMISKAVAFNGEKDAKFEPLVAGPGTDEPPVLGAVNYLRKLFNDESPEASKHALVGSSMGVSGRAVEQLSKGAKPKHYDRFLSAVQASKAAADLEKKSYGIAAICWMQGESNYSPGGDWTPTKEGYKTKLLKLRDDLNADAVKGIAGQKEVPAFVMYQTGAAYSNDTNFLSIGMAQWEMAQEVPGIYMATPVYPYVDYGGHLTANGYRWIGAQFAKVLNKILVKGEDWKPLSPRSVQRDGRKITIDYHVPEPPLVFASPYIGRKLAEIPPDKGFLLYDSSGIVEIESIRIVNDTMVEIVGKRDFDGDVYVRYAGKTKYDGNGFLRDSDSTLAEDVYVFDPASKQLPDENLVELVGKPYPLYNWSIAFNLKADPVETK